MYSLFETSYFKESKTELKDYNPSVLLSEITTEFQIFIHNLRCTVLISSGIAANKDTQTFYLNWSLTLVNRLKQEF